MMKNIWTQLVLSMTCAALVGCGGSSSSNNTPTPTPTPTPTTVTPSVPPTPATQLAKTGALTGDVLVLAAVTGTMGAAAMRRKRS